jgi:uncharacterized protein YndB with AHSA1/START domain
MPKYELVDEAVIDAPPILVYKAVLDEYAGVTHWFMPLIEYKPRGNAPVREGTTVDAIINPKSRTKIKCSTKVTKLVEGKLIEEEYAGDFVGTGGWTFEPTDGKTKLKQYQNTRTTKLLFSIVASFVNVEKGHSETMQKGFKSLNSYLSKK